MNAGFIIGFSLQDTLSKFATDKMVLIYNPYDIDDLVKVRGGVLGKVESMNFVSTTMPTIDNQTLVIPMTLRKQKTIVTCTGI